MTNPENNEMAKPIQNLLLTSKIPEDQPVLQLIGELSRLVKGMKPKDAFRYWVLQKLPGDIDQLRSNGGQLIGGQN